MIAYGLSDKGRVRATNQDNYAIYLQENLAIAAVCDGMGGANAGNVASKFALDTFMDTLKQQLTASAQIKEIEAMLVEATRKANQTVYNLSCAQPEFRGMGTTLVAAVILPEALLVVNVGDSRAYRIDQSHAERLTEDHSYVEEMLRSGRITAEAARTHPKKNLITRAVGIDPDVMCDIYETKLGQNEILLLCSDGLSGMVRDERIAAIAYGASSLESATHCLIDEALLSGGLDNVTAVLLTHGTATKE